MLSQSPPANIKRVGRHYTPLRAKIPTDAPASGDKKIIFISKCESWVRRAWIIAAWFAIESFVEDIFVVDGLAVFRAD